MERRGFSGSVLQALDLFKPGPFKHVGLEQPALKLTGVGTTFPYDGPLWFLKYVMALSLLSPLLFALGKGSC